MTNTVALIGGSGVIDNPDLSRFSWDNFNTGYRTPWGDGVVEYARSDDGIIFIPRHGRSARYGPAETQYAANVIAAKMLGADCVLATSAVGTLNESIEVGSLVIPKDFVDESGRDDNLFGTGFVVHPNPRPPFAEELRFALYRAALKTDYFGKANYDGTYVVIPGNRFGTTAEGRRRAMYADIVGMTIAPEASYCMQVGLPYAVVAVVVDKDTDAGHESQTLKVMGELSKSDRMPLFIVHALRIVKKTELAVPLKQLEGNIILEDQAELDRIKNLHLRRIAEELLETYC